MKTIKRYKLLLQSSVTDRGKQITEFREYKGLYDTPITDIFDTEEEAVAAAYKADKWSTWIVIPHISFDNFES